MPMGQWGGQMLLVDWLAETLEEGPWEAGCHSGPGTWLERHVGTALMTDRALALVLQSQAENSDWAV